STININWYEANQRHLLAALAVVRCALEKYNAKEQLELEAQQQALHEAAAAMSAPSALDRLCRIFNLSLFERDLLLLCAGVEFSGEFAKLCAIAQGDP
ncbi:MAG: ATP-binding protein, partial [Nostoc sp.]